MKRTVIAGSSLATFDDELGTVIDRHSTDTRATGFVEEVGGKCVALYADNGVLMLQIALERFPVATSKLTYAHNWDDGTTTFGASYADRTAAVTYPAWWAEADVGQWEVRGVPERDEDEDTLAVIARRVAEDPSERRRLLSDWEP